MARLTLAFLILTAATCVIVCSEVQEESLTFSCSTGTIKLNEACESICDADDTTFCHFRPGKGPICSSPCKTLEGAAMTLDECVAFNVTVICKDEDGKVKETLSMYSGEDSHSPRSRGMQGPEKNMLLLMLPMLLWICRC